MIHQRRHGPHTLSEFRPAAAMLGCLVLFLLLTESSVAQDFWTSVGPYTIPIYHLYRNPRNGAMYALTGGSGSAVWSSMDGGKHWSGKSWGANNQSMLVSASGTLYLGSAMNFWRSTDLGGSWKQIRMSQAPILDLCEGPTGKLFAGSYHGGLLVSTDAGDSWSTSYAGSPGNIIQTIFRDARDILLIGGSADGIRRSTDDGTTWVETELNTGGISAIASNEFGTLWAGSMEGRLYNSTDTGMHWTEFVTGVSSAISAIHASRQYGILIGTQSEGIFRSTDGCATWLSTRGPFSSQSGNCFFIDTNGDLLAGTEQYLARTSNGVNWSVGGIPFTRITDLDMQPDGTLFVAEYGERVKTSHDRCATFTTLGPPGYPIWPVTLGFTSRGDLFIGMNNEGLYRTTNRGESWTRMSNGLPAMGVFAIDFDGDSGVFIGTNQGVYRSSDNGDHWQSAGLPGISVQSLAIQRDSIVIVGTASGAAPGMYRSSDRGKNWEKIIPIGGGTDIFTLFRYDSTILYAGITGQGILTSTDEGITWSRIPNPLPSTGIHAFARNANGVMYAATDGGIYISTDRWKTWTNPRDGLWTLNTSSVAIAPDGYLYAGTYDWGIFRSAAPVTEAGHERRWAFPASLSLEIAPMPVRDRAVIRYVLPAAGHVRMELLDALGRQVRLLEDADRHAGTHDLAFARHDLPAGLYMCRMSSGQAQSIRKLILVR